MTRRLKSIAQALLSLAVPVPAPLKPFLRALYFGHFSVKRLGQWFINVTYRSPLFRSRCHKVGKGFRLTLLPDVSDHTTIIIGDDVSLFGHFGVSSGRIFDTPMLVIGDRVKIAHQVYISVNQEVTIEDDVMVASNCYISDNDGHPLDAELRISGSPPLPRDVKPVRIKRKAWIGSGSFIMKGTTIGEGAVIGANSVVTSDIPDYCLAAGSPARVVMTLDTAPAPAQFKTEDTACG